MKQIREMIKRNLAVLLGISLVWANVAVPGQAAIDRIEEELEVLASDSDAETATDSDLILEATASNLRVADDLWEDWSGTDFKFLDGDHGKGTKKQPYQIRNKAHLRALSQLAALDMTIEPGELESDAYEGDYEGAYFELTANIDLAGTDWIPIGFYRQKEEMTGMVPHPFRGHFDGKGYTISNYRILAQNWNDAGLFGAIEDSTISNLNVQISDTLTAGDRAGILTGYAEGDVIIRNCTVRGNVRGKGLVGGVAGYVAGTGRKEAAIENCKADVTLDSLPSDYGYPVSVGGIAGQADRVTIIDCEVETADNGTARIQGKGYVGGITGWQNDADLYQVTVSSGTIGGNGAVAIGGITGYYTSGDIKVARMNGTLGSSGLGNYAHEGVFMGNKGSGCNFTYGTDREDDLAYLFTDKEAKLNMGVCGSDVPDDNAYTYQDHIGFWHSGDLYFTLKQGNRTKTHTDLYFYEELEQGVLSVMDRELEETGLPYQIDHVAPDATGRPKRGYLISIPQIDTAAGGTYFYDVATLTASGTGAYYRPLDKDLRGAVAEGTTVLITTSPNHTDTEKYQMSEAPFYIKNGVKTAAAYVTGGQYSFSMPANDTEITAVYKRVAADITVSPMEYTFQVVQTRTGNRKAPTLTTVVTGNTGTEIARYVNGTLASAQVQPVTIQKTVDTNNDVADSRVLWSVDDGNLIRLLENDDKDQDGYTDKSASIQVKLDSPFFTDIIRSQEEKQAESGYRYGIPATIYGAGHAGGGVAILTASTRNSESFEGKPCTAQSRIKVTFQILDQTFVDVEDIMLDKSMVEFVITRTLTGNRNAPAEVITVTPPQTLTAAVLPSFFSKKQVRWMVDDPSVARVIFEEDAYQTGRIEALSETKWIQDIIAADRVKKQNDPYQKVNGSGVRETKVTVKADDQNGNSRQAGSTVRVRFMTEDKTGIGGGSSGGSGGSSGGSGGSGSSGITPAGMTKSAGGPAGAVSGTWVQDGAGNWLFTGNGRTYANEWAYIHNPYADTGMAAADWFCFDEKGHMRTGWFTDAEGNTYYFHEASDGGKGRMYQGWNRIGEQYYYFRTESGTNQGMLIKNATTPDGYQVDETGAWIRRH